MEEELETIGEDFEEGLKRRKKTALSLYNILFLFFGMIFITLELRPLILLMVSLILFLSQAKKPPLKAEVFNYFIFLFNFSPGLK